jgi:arylsulfatase A-like enzyme
MTKGQGSVVLLVSSLTLALLGSRGTATAQGPGPLEVQAPNILLIVTDDQRWDTLQYLPNMQRLVHRGRIYPNAFVPNPLCCPSRVSILTGNHSHTTGVYANHGSSGGFAAFKDRVSIATALDATYRTGLVGKYLNGYPNKHYRYVPPGWNAWVAIGGGTYYDYELAINGRRSRHFGTSAEDYSGRVLTERALTFIMHPSTKPFFLVFTPIAPHVANGGDLPIPDPLDDGLLDGTVFDHAPSYAEQDVSDKPPFIQQAQVMDKPLLFQKQLEALMGVDRSIRMLMKAVPDNTLVILTSDNGFLLGEHRWWGKSVPYNEALRVPLVLRCVRCSLIEPATKDRRVALNIDLAATILDAAGLPRDTPTAIRAATGERIAPEGKSLLRHGWDREGFVVEHLGDGGKAPSLCGIRTSDYLFVHYADGFEEVYDERVDPWEMENIAGTAEVPTDDLRARAIVLCDPVPPGFGWSD